MNNKGFAITTILYGLLILFCLLLVSILGILTTYRGNLEKLIDNTAGSRDTITMRPIRNYNTLQDVKNDASAVRGLYCFSNNTCKYVSNRELD